MTQFNAACCVIDVRYSFLRGIILNTGRLLVPFLLNYNTLSFQRTQDS